MPLLEKVQVGRTKCERKLVLSISVLGKIMGVCECFIGKRKNE